MNGHVIDIEKVELDTKRRVTEQWCVGDTLTDWLIDVMLCLFFCLYLVWLIRWGYAIISKIT